MNATKLGDLLIVAGSGACMESPDLNPVPLRCEIDGHFIYMAGLILIDYNTMQKVASDKSIS